MLQHFERFELSLDHPWGRQAVDWVTSEIFPYYGDLSLEEQLYMHDMPGYHYHGLTVDDQLVAVGTLRLPWGASERMDSITLPTMVVKPELQGRGLGGIMLGYLEETARQMGGTEMHLRSRTESRERAFWLRHGYTKPDNTVEAALLIKRLVS